MSKLRWLITKTGSKRKTMELKVPGQEKFLETIVRAEEIGDYQVEIVVKHEVENTKAKVEVRVIAGGGAKVKIVGMIKIGKGADGVDSFLDVRAILLDNVSSVEVEPKLEIEANQVKASHAATVAPLDEAQLFYMMGRGLTRSEAEKMLIRGFLGD